MSLSHCDLFKKVREFKFDADHPALLTFVLDHQDIALNNLSETDYTIMNVFVKNFAKLSKKKWREVHRSQGKFEKKFGDWLSKDLAIPDLSKSNENTDKASTSIDFSKLTKTERERFTASLRKENGGEKLFHAAQIALKTEGAHDLAFVMDEIIKSPKQATKLRNLSGIAKKMENKSEQSILLPRKISPSDALLHILDNNLTEEAYTSMQLISKEHDADIWPTYSEVCVANKM